MPSDGNSGSSAELLGFAPDARVLLINADDFGMYVGVNRGVMEAIDQGVVSSASLLTVCPGTDDALARALARPDIPVGVHLTLVSESPAQRWVPRSDPSRLRSIVDGDGCLEVAGNRDQLLARAEIDEVEREVRAQLAAVLEAGLAPTHLDWHCLADGGRDDIIELTVEVALEHGLAARVWSSDARARLRTRGLPVVDNDFLDSFALDVEEKEACLLGRLHDLSTGLTEWAVHPGDDDPGSRAIDRNWRVRDGDRRALTSAGLRRALNREGIHVVDPRVVKAAWGRRAV